MSHPGRGHEVWALGGGFLLMPPLLPTSGGAMDPLTSRSLLDPTISTIHASLLPGTTPGPVRDGDGTIAQLGHDFQQLQSTAELLQDDLATQAFLLNRDAFAQEADLAQQCRILAIEQEQHQKKR